MKKKILIIYPGILFPAYMAMQKHIINIINYLSKDHEVDVVNLYKDKENRDYNSFKLKNICNNVYMVKKPNNNFFSKKILWLFVKIHSYFTSQPFTYYYPNSRSVINKIIRIIEQNNYDIVQLEIWFQGKIFEMISDDIYKVINKHDVMYEKRELEMKNNNGPASSSDARKLNKYRQMELYNTSLADLIISISSHDSQIFKSYFPNKNHIQLPIGQELGKYSNYNKKHDQKTILFYGSMSGEQNIVGFWRLYNKIYPLIKKKIPEVKLLVLGAKPPKEIKSLHNGNSIVVTDFVDDVRKYIAKSTLMILPLEISGGFRGRVVEVMAMGVPVIGTHNALDCVEMENGVHGYITDSNQRLAQYAIKIMQDISLRSEMSNNCRKFVKAKYSLDETYGKLSEFYYNID